MSRSLLFGYSVAREDGRVIVTIEGEMAGEVMAGLTRRGRRGASAFPFGPLGSPSMGLASLFSAGEQPGVEGEDEEEEAGGTQSLAEVFGQGFDRSYGEYEARLSAYREILASEDTIAAPSPEQSAPEPAESVEPGGGKRAKPTS